MAKKEFTHIYHEKVEANTVAIGDSLSNAIKNIELFQKSLVLTGDIKRLPVLLGGKLAFLINAHSFNKMSTSVLSGLEVAGVLMNGHYEQDDFTDLAAIYDDDRAKDDMLMTVWGIMAIKVPYDNPCIEITDSHWDFEGKTILYDTLTLIMFLAGNANVGSADLDGHLFNLTMEIEVDWEPINQKEMQEFIMEHIYAKQGD